MVPTRKRGTMASNGFRRSVIPRPAEIVRYTSPAPPSPPRVQGGRGMCASRTPGVQGGRGMRASREAAHLLSPCTRGDDRGAPISRLLDRADLKYHRKSSLSRSHETISAARGIAYRMGAFPASGTPPFPLPSRVTGSSHLSPSASCAVRWSGSAFRVAR